MDVLDSPRRGLFATAARDLARCIIPVACPGCGADDVRLCDACAAPWWDEPLRCEHMAPRLIVDGEAIMPVWSITELRGEAHEVVAAWKDAGRRDLDAFFGAAMGRQARAVGVQAACVVPVPSRPGSYARRGAALTHTLARAASTALRVPAHSVLTVGRGESRGASARQRWRAAQQSVMVRRDPRGSVVLVDDVMTTGATLAACAEALHSRGTTVRGALVLACA